mmetsp:Transcript_22647/g.28478  ORF Transcript_22647/g.28478 Transcript_22647/m.28478 type:complete len:125 (+) Transcript_22647:2-376(+)
MHCTVLNVNYCLYCVAGTEEIIYCALIHFSTNILRHFSDTIVNVLDKFVPYLRDRSSLPEYDNADDWGYGKSRNIVHQQLQLKEKYVELVLERGSPLPKLLRIIPNIVFVWNKTKGGWTQLARY